MFSDLQSHAQQGKASRMPSGNQCFVALAGLHLVLETYPRGHRWPLVVPIQVIQLELQMKKAQEIAQADRADQSRLR